MRNLGGAGPLDNCANPGQRRENHIDHGPLHENLEGSVPIAQAMIDHAKHAVDQAKDHPSNHA